MEKSWYCKTNNKARKLCQFDKHYVFQFNKTLLLKDLHLACKSFNLQYFCKYCFRLYFQTCLLELEILFTDFSKTITITHKSVKQLKLDNKII